MRRHISSKPRTQTSTTSLTQRNPSEKSFSRHHHCEGCKHKHRPNYIEQLREQRLAKAYANQQLKLQQKDDERVKEFELHKSEYERKMIDEEESGQKSLLDEIDRTISDYVLSSQHKSLILKDLSTGKHKESSEKKPSDSSSFMIKDFIQLKPQYSFTVEVESMGTTYGRTFTDAKYVQKAMEAIKDAISTQA